MSHVSATGSGIPGLHGRAPLRPAVQRVADARQEEYSRSSWPGSIEAPLSAPQDIRVFRIPGLHGRAPLRQLLSGPMTGTGKGIPGLHGRAPLRLVSVRAVGSEGAAGIPGLHGRAPLRLVPVHAVYRPVARIPGLHGRAPLRREPPRLGDGLALVFPVFMAGLH